MTKYNKTLQTNNSSLEEIISKLNTMPDAGEDVKTCSIKFVNNSGGSSFPLKELAYNNVINGGLQFVCETDITVTSEKIINNIPCGSLVYFIGGCNDTTNYFLDENLLKIFSDGNSLYTNYVFRTSNDADAVGVITYQLYPDSGSGE